MILPSIFDIGFKDVSGAQNEARTPSSILELPEEKLGVEGGERVNLGKKEKERTEVMAAMLRCTLHTLHVFLQSLPH